MDRHAPIDRGVLAGRAACAAAWLFALPSFYWGFGGHVGADTVGTWAARLTWADDPSAMTAILVTAVLKVAAGFLALALIHPERPPLPRGLLLTAGRGATALLVLYGGIQFGTALLIEIGVLDRPDDFDAHAFHWHLYLWSPWFLIWGLLLGRATAYYRSHTAHPATTT